MKAYFIRRLLLVPITLLGVTMIVFAISRAVPGGPVQMALQQASQGNEDGKGSNDKTSGSIDEDEIEKLEEEFGYDKPVAQAYLQWLGLWKKESNISKGEFKRVERIRKSDIEDSDLETLVLLSGEGRMAKITRSDAESTEVSSAVFLDTGEPIAENGWEFRIESPDDRVERAARRLQKGTRFDEEEGRIVIDHASPTATYAYRAVAYKGRFTGLMQGNLGRSSFYNDRVIDMILERMPIALYFGLLTAIITYGVCIPLGIVKALKHRTLLDNSSSILIFIGYSVPGFALGAVLLVYLGARMQWFPLTGLVSAEFDTLDTWSKIKDLAHHTVLPLIAYVTGGFAVTTMMMKNNLMDNLSADYVRTAVAKGVSFRTAVFRHAFRNSFIPIATGLGNLITIIIGGSMLIEQVFDIPGFGLLQFQAIQDRDIPVIMGTLTIAAFLMLIGNILSDFIVSLVDPRIKFN